MHYAKAFLLCDAMISRIEISANFSPYRVIRYTGSQKATLDV